MEGDEESNSSWVVAVEEQEEEKKNPRASLPDHLLTIVLARLPLIQLLQLQTLSKSWRSVIRSPAFSQLQSEAHNSSESWLVMERDPFEGPDDFLAYCPTSGRWFAFPPDSDVRGFDYALRSAGGLICSWTDDDGGTCFTVLVHDILKGTSKKLPSPPWGYDFWRHGLCHVCIDMVANSAIGSYQVILSNAPGYFNRYYEYLEVYDSRSGRWKLGQGILSGNFTGTVLNGDLFYLVQDKDRIVAYNRELDTWSIVKAPKPSCMFEGGSLDLVGKIVIKCKERLVLLAGLVSRALLHNERSTDQIPMQGFVLPDERSTKQIPMQGFGVWELHYIRHDTASWVEVARTPTEYWKGLYSVYQISACYSYEFHIANENLICMIGFLFADGDEKIIWLPLVYDLAHDSWHRLPGHDGGDIVDYLGVFTFYPKLNAMI